VPSSVEIKDAFQRALSEAESHYEDDLRTASELHQYRLRQCDLLYDADKAIALQQYKVSLSEVAICKRTR